MSAKKIFQDENLWLWLLAGATLAIVCLVRLRLLGVALERDEGEYAYMGQQLLKGVLPYTESYSMKFPGIYIVYAIILAIFGHSHTGIHFALALANLASAFLLFQIGRRLFNKTVGVSAGASFAVITLSPAVQGLWANAEHFVVLFALAGILLTLSALEKDNKPQLFLAGLALGFSFLIKQHGVLFFLFVFIYVCLFYFRKDPGVLQRIILKVTPFVVGGLTPLALTAVIYIGTNNFGAFWFWTFEYASEYVSLVPLAQGIDLFVRAFGRILQANWLVLLLSLLGLVAVAWDKSIRKNYAFSFGFLAISFLAITPGLYFRPHYFILLTPALALFAGIGLSVIVDGLSSRRLKTFAALCVLSVSFAASFYQQKEFFFAYSTLEASRYTYGLNPFPESLAIAEYINKNTDEEDAVAILGSEPQINFYARRRSATGFLYMYPLMENHKYARLMQESMIKEIESRQPKFIVFVNSGSSWGIRPSSDPLLFNWQRRYIMENYELAGLAHILSRDKTIYKWGTNAADTYWRSIVASSGNIGMLVYKRKI